MRSVLVFLGLFLLAASGKLIHFGSETIEIDEARSQYAFHLGQNKAWLPQRHGLHLKMKTLDPLATPNLEAAYLQAIRQEFPAFEMDLSRSHASDKKGLYLIQFHTQVRPSYRQALERLGAEIHFSFPSQALLCSINPSALHEVSSLEIVRFVGAYSPLMKIGPDVAEMLSSRSFAPESHRFNLMLVKRGEAAQNKLARVIETQFKGRVLAKITEGFRMEVELPVEELVRLLATEETLLFADLWTPAGEDMDIARLSGGIEYLSKVQGYNGEGVRAEVMDSGLYASHTDYADLNVMIHGGNGASTSHGSSVFGVVFGTGATNPNAMGGIPKANASIFAAYDLLSGTYTRYRHTEELVDGKGEYRAVFQTNSWGNSQTTSYTTISAEMDDILFLNDITILQSQSNTGNRNSRPQAWAKNIVSVGAFNHYDTLSRSDDRWAGGASIGPASDGRQKPDLCHYYDRILTTSNSNNGYTQFGGTSGATPITAGHFGVFFQLWADGVFSGRKGATADVFEARPRASTSKAIMINTAKQFDFNEASTDLIRAHQGWGTADVARLFDLAQQNRWSLPLLVDESDALGPLESVSYTVSVSSNLRPAFLKVSLVYRDPMPAVSASKQLINNLDLQVVSPSGEVYWGNHGLDRSPCSSEGGEPSEVDTVENVFVCGAESGVWTVTVLGTEILEGTNPRSPALEAVFSLVATTGRMD